MDSIYVLLNNRLVKWVRNIDTGHVYGKESHGYRLRVLARDHGEWVRVRVLQTMGTGLFTCVRHETMVMDTGTGIQL